ncbi:MAG: hypothetical protein ACK56I_15060, partial [bacterium]
MESLGYRYRTIRGAATEQNIATEDKKSLSQRQESNLDELTSVGDELRGNTQTKVPSMRSARDMDGADLAEGSVHIIQQYPFTAERKMMSTLVSLDPSNPLNGPVRVYVSGASE